LFTKSNKLLAHMLPTMYAYVYDWTRSWSPKCSKLLAHMLPTMYTYVYDWTRSWSPSLANFLPVCCQLCTHTYMIEQDLGHQVWQTSCPSAANYAQIHCI
jgi:hypothetical protein